MTSFIGSSPPEAKDQGLQGTGEPFLKKLIPRAFHCAGGKGSSAFAQDST